MAASSIPSHTGRRRSEIPKQVRQMWFNMMSRCYKVSDLRFKDYGGRGIGVCDEWRNDKPSFYRWVLEHGWSVGLQIDRYPDNDGDYRPGNCRITTPLNNMASNRRTSLLTAFGESKSIGQWSIDPRCQASRVALRARVARGWNLELAISSPNQDKSHVTRTCEICQSEYTTVRHRKLHCCSKRCGSILGARKRHLVLATMP